MPDAFSQLFDRIGGPRRALVAGVGLVAVALVLLASRWATRPTWVPVFSGLALESVGPLTDKLEQAGIQYRLEAAGTQLQVQSQDIARARVAVARDGGIPNAGRPGLELFDQPSWSMTDFTQRINYRRALEGELERTIGKMRGIESAQVHLAMQESSSFRTSSMKPEASVVLKPRGETPSREVVQGIAHLVASSVDGLESERVTIVDDGGRLLSVPNEVGSIGGLTSQQLSLQREIEEHFEQKASALLAQIVGQGNARVQVAAAVNFDKVERKTETLDPEKQVAAVEQKAEIVPGAQGGAGSSNTATTYENSKSTEVFSGAVGGLRRITVAVLVNDRQVGTPDAPRFEPRSPLEIARIDTLVRSAVGIDESRGDVVSVVSVPFDVPAVVQVEEPTPTLVDRAKEYQQPITSGLSIVAAMIIGVMVLRALRVPAPAPTATATVALPAPVEEPVEALPPPRPRPQPVVPANAYVREQVVATVEERPDTAARLVRAWMKE